jgi:hypothetical protein
LSSFVHHPSFNFLRSSFFVHLIRSSYLLHFPSFIFFLTQCCCNVFLSLHRRNRRG